MKIVVLSVQKYARMYGILEKGLRFFSINCRYVYCVSFIFQGRYFIFRYCKNFFAPKKLFVRLEILFQKMALDVQKQKEKREKFSRRRRHDPDADIDYINERNMKFNQKLER